VLVLPSTELLQNLSDEVDRPIVALVGGSFLREFVVTIDAPAGELQLDRYASRAHIPADEYVGPGFTLVASPDGTWRVSDVYAGTDAAAEGLVPGDVVEELGGQSITGLPEPSVSAILDGFTVGQEVAVGVLGGGGFVTKLVTIEDLLPGYPGKTP
jgi:C-terminal processing protease CtpA/Prc